MGWLNRRQKYAVVVDRTMVVAACEMAAARAFADELKAQIQPQLPEDRSFSMTDCNVRFSSLDEFILDCPQLEIEWR